MKRTSIIVAAALAALASPPWLAAHETTSRGSGATCKGLHEMSGRVTDVDHTAGTLSMQSSDGQDLSLHFPPSTLRNINEGDHVTVQLAIHQAAARQPKSDVKASGTGSRTLGEPTGVTGRTPPEADAR